MAKEYRVDLHERNRRIFNVEAETPEKATELTQKYIDEMHGAIRRQRR